MSFSDGSSGLMLRQDFKRLAVEGLEEGKWGSYGDFRLVGNGEKTRSDCGDWVSFKGCLNVEGHDKSFFDGRGNLVSCRNKVYFRHIRRWCYKPSCPECFEHGFAIREAGNIETRLREASKLSGLVEHIVVSVPVKDFGLEYNALRRKAIKVLKSRGVVGGCMIFHGFRVNKVGLTYWYWSPHFHVLGYILGGYSRCRSCKNRVCVGFGNFGRCDGFEAKVRRLGEKDGYIVKVLGERKTIFGTAFYQLTHSSYRVDVVRFHVATWFGICSYRKLKVTVEKRKELCPLCREELISIAYYGRRHIVKDRFSSEYKRSGWMDYEEEGVPVWFEYVKPERGSGSYEEY